MYCGATLPEGAAETAEEVESRALPNNLDDLVRRAMLGGNTHALEQAMREASAPAEPVGLDEPDEEVVLDVSATLEALAAQVDIARTAWDQEDTRTVSERLRSVRESLDVLVSAIPDHVGSDDTTAEPEPDAPFVPLPRVHRAFGLVVDGIDDSTRGPDIAGAIDIDGVTARLIAIARHPRVVLRGNERDALEGKATALREVCGVQAVVVDADALTAIGPADAMICAAPGEGLSVVVAPMNDWTHAEAKPGEPEAMPRALSVFLVVPGELVIEQYRSMKQGGRLKHIRENRTQVAGERRLGVVDLHVPEGIIRVLEGVSDLADMPGHSGNAFRQSVRGLLKVFEAAPDTRVLETRSCKANLESGAIGSGDDRGTDTGWAVWEEHSRSSRLLVLSGSD